MSGASSPERPRTKDLPLASWERHPAMVSAAWETGNGRIPGNIGRARLANSGVARADLRSWYDLHPDWSLGAADGVLYAELRRLCGCAPSMPLRDAVGWVLVAAHLNPHRSAPFATQFLDWWPGVLQHCGWVFAAAGLSPAEVTGTPAEVEAATAMAALRGAVMPA